MNKAILTLGLEEPRVALAALAPDDDGFVATQIVGGNLRVTAQSDSVMGLLRSLDDVLGCLRATGIE